MIIELTIMENDKHLRYANVLINIGIQIYYNDIN